MAWVAILGGAKPFGTVLVSRLQDRGWMVASLDRVGNPDADLSLQLDSLDEASIAGAMSEIGPLRGLVCIPDSESNATIAQLEWIKWKSVIDSNVTAPMLAMKQSQWIDQGAVVLMSSAESIGTSSGNLAHSTAYGAILGLMRASCGEFAEFGVRVNAVSTRVPLAKKHMVGTAEAVAFLLSSDSGFITGEELIVDGGLRRKPDKRSSE